MSDTKGFIYILTNPSFPEYVKIGYADNVEKRLDQLNRSECIPFAFRVYATYEVQSRLSDLKVHSIIDKLNPNLRSIDNFKGQKRIREFYAMSKEDAYSILEAIADINGQSDKLKKMEMSVEEKKDEETAEEIEENSLLKKRKDFWTKFNQRIDEKGNPFKTGKPNTDVWHNVAIGTGEAQISINLVNRNHQVVVELYINNNKNLFDRLFQKKTDIEDALDMQFDWDRLEGKKACRIKHTIQGLDFEDQSNYDDLMDEIIDKVVRMRKVFKKYI